VDHTWGRGEPQIRRWRKGQGAGQLHTLIRGGPQIILQISANCRC
jgi:hypothetical protein